MKDFPTILHTRLRLLRYARLAFTSHMALKHTLRVPEQLMQQQHSRYPKQPHRTPSTHR